MNVWFFLAPYISPDQKKSNSTLEDGQKTFCSIQFDDEHGENYKHDLKGSDDDGGYTEWCLCTLYGVKMLRINK